MQIVQNLDTFMVLSQVSKLQSASTALLRASSDQKHDPLNVRVLVCDLQCPTQTFLGPLEPLKSLIFSVQHKPF